MRRSVLNRETTCSVFECVGQVAGVDGVPLGVVPGHIPRLPGGDQRDHDRVLQGEKEVCAGAVCRSCVHYTAPKAAYGMLSGGY